MSRMLFATVVAAALVATAAAAAEPAAPPSDAAIHKILVDRIDVAHQGVGIVVGLIDAHGRRHVVAYGRSDQGDSRPVDGDTVFEIGSMTKTFTGLLLSDMAARGEVQLDDPAAKYLPADTTLPSRNGRQITLADLGTHTSGLPRMPSNMAPKDPNNPYADYTVAQMYAFLKSCQLTRDPGSQYEYSNLGAGLLGHLLALRLGESYEAAVHDRITGPLGMTDTAITLTPSMRARLAVGHDGKLKPTENWDLPTLAGAGALRSTVNDMLKFMAAEVGDTRTPLNGPMQAAVALRRPTPSPNGLTALGWNIRTAPGDEIVWKNGGTGGYRSFMGFDPRTHVAVVVLSNTSTAIGVDDIGVHILTGEPVVPPPVPHHAVHLDQAELDRLVGRYQLGPKAILTIGRGGDRLFAQLTGQGPFEVLPEGPLQVFWKDADVQASFQVDASGRVTGLTLHQSGHETPAPRIP